MSTNFHNDGVLSHQPLGMLLVEADLIHSAQLQVALEEQKYYTNLRIGEILALHGWLKQETADFFAETWKALSQGEGKKRLGTCLQEAGLIDAEQIENILKEQIQLGVKFGSVAVLKGWISQQTLNFFLRYIAPNAANESAFVRKQSLKEKTQPGRELHAKTIEQKLSDTEEDTVEILDPEKIGEIPWLN